MYRIKCRMVKELVQFFDCIVALDAIAVPAEAYSDEFMQYLVRLAIDPMLPDRGDTFVLLAEQFR